MTLRALERLELTLSDTPSSCAGTWAGYLVDDGALSDLPVGAAIDPAGTFYWQPGPGFIGTLRTAVRAHRVRWQQRTTAGARHYSGTAVGLDRFRSSPTSRAVHGRSETISPSISPSKGIHRCAPPGHPLAEPLPA